MTLIPQGGNKILALPRAPVSTLSEVDDFYKEIWSLENTTPNVGVAEISTLVCVCVCVDIYLPGIF